MFQIVPSWALAVALYYVFDGSGVGAAALRRNTVRASSSDSEEESYCRLITFVTLCRTPTSHHPKLVWCAEGAFCCIEGSFGYPKLRGGAGEPWLWEVASYKLVGGAVILTGSIIYISGRRATEPPDEEPP